jgi:hypothetical protein
MQQGKPHVKSNGGDRDEGEMTGGRPHAPLNYAPATLTTPGEDRKRAIGFAHLWASYAAGALWIVAQWHEAAGVSLTPSYALWAICSPIWVPVRVVVLPLIARPSEGFSVAQHAMGTVCYVLVFVTAYVWIRRRAKQPPGKRECASDEATRPAA